MECKNQCGFFASKNGFCSKCFSSTQKIESKDMKSKECKDMGNGERCFKCNKKLRTNILICKCQKKFCSQHIFHTDHDCDFDFKTFGKKIIEEQNPKVAPSQL